MAGALSRLDDTVRGWSAGRNPWVRAPLLLWLGWILVEYWDDPWHRTIFQGIDLAFHEIGHILWSPLGDFMAIAGGTLTQVLIPVAAAAMLYRQRDWFGVAFAIGWLGITCFETVPYAGDALARQLPLVSPSTAEPIHDWTWMLAELNALQHTETVADAWQMAGRVFMLAGILFGARVLWHTATTAKADGGDGTDAELTAEGRRFRESLGRGPGRGRPG